jgi:hypothetical protein
MKREPMTTDDRFDEAIRAQHAQSLDHLSPRVRAQLQQRRRAAMAGESPTAERPWRLAWPIAAACALGVLVIGMQLRSLPEPTTTPAVVATTPATPNDEGAEYATLEESPDLYVWLASDGATLAME